MMGNEISFMTKINQITFMTYKTEIIQTTSMSFGVTDRVKLLSLNSAASSSKTRYRNRIRNSFERAKATL